MHELEILMWWARPWQALPVHVNFGATSSEQSMSLPKLPLLLTCDATRPGTGLQSYGWAWQCWRKVMGRVEEHQDFTTSSPTPLGRNGCYGAPRMRRGAPSQTGSWLCGQMSSFTTYQCFWDPKALNTAAARMWVNREAAWHVTQDNSKDPPHGTMLSWIHPRDWAAPLAITHRAWASPPRPHHRRRGWGGSWHCLGAIMKHLNTLYKLFI